MDIREVHQSVVQELQERLLLLSGGYPFRDMAQTIEEITEHFQALAICHLLQSLDTDKFRENLVRSGHARLYFLRKCEEHKIDDDRHLAISRSQAFLDTLTAGDIELSKEIAQRSITHWNGNWEYEDDFCFYHFLHTMLLNISDLPEEELKKILTQFEISLEGQDSFFFEICTSLLSKDRRLITESLTKYLDSEFRVNEAKRKETSGSENMLFWPRSYISIPGLALLRVAELIGIHIENELPLCPPDARLKIQSTDYEDIFKSLEAALKS